MIAIRKVCRLHHDVAQAWLSKLLPPSNDYQEYMESERLIEIGQSFAGKPLLICKDTAEEYWLVFLDDKG